MGNISSTRRCTSESSRSSPWGLPVPPRSGAHSPAPPPTPRVVEIPMSSLLIPSPLRFGRLLLAPAALVVLASACARRAEAPPLAEPSSAQKSSPPAGAAATATPQPVPAEPSRAEQGAPASPAVAPSRQAPGGRGEPSAPSDKAPAAKRGAVIGQDTGLGLGLRPCCQALLATAATTPPPGDANAKDAASYCMGAVAALTPSDDALAEIRLRLSGTPVPASCR